MDVGVGNGLIIFFFIFLVFSFVAFLINMLVSCCDEFSGNDTDPNAAIIAANLNSRIHRQTSHYRFRYDIPYDSNERRASLRQAIDPSFEMPACSYRYGYPLPSPAQDHLNVSPLSRTASYRSTHSSMFVELPPVREVEHNPLSDSSSQVASTSEEPPPSYNEAVGYASSFI